MKCIILAGGYGERLWPISRELYPKTLLDIFNGKTLIQNTFELAKEIVSVKNILTITNIRQSDDIRLKLKEYTKNPIVISEPMAKNTAPAVASALTYLGSEKDEYVLILPVDFKVENVDSLKKSINEAKLLAKDGYIVALGVKPEYPETEFGYIEAKEVIKNNSKKVSSFVEKPSLKEVEEFVKNPDYLWNCGIYIAKASTLIQAYSEYAPAQSKDFDNDMFDENNKIKFSYYEQIPELSIDYAIMMKAKNIAVVELQTKWFDYGSWRAVYNTSKKDSKGNIVNGNVILDNVKNSFVYSSKNLVSASSIKDTIIVETEDAVLVCDKSKATDISKIVKKLKELKVPATVSRKTMFRPWGYYTCLNGGDGWLTKIITVAPGHKLSLQSHNYRSEHWVVLEGKATVLLDDEVHELEKRQSINIPIKAKHSLQNHTKMTLKILEVQKGSYIGEDDIIRYEDIYGRAN